MSLPEIRSFAVSRRGVVSVMSVADHVALIGASPAVSAAYDLLTDDGMSPDKAADLAVAAERSGRDPEAFARHTVKLRRSLRASRAN